MVAPSTLVPNEKNPRRHSTRQRRALLSAIETVGVIQDMIVSKRSGKLLDGHLRLELALAEKQESIPVKYVDVDEHEEALVMATFDPVGRLALLDMDGSVYITCYCLPSEREARLAEALQFLDRLEGRSER